MSLYNMWILMAMMMVSGVDDPHTAKGMKEMPCKHDYQCGHGDCWVGVCVDGGCLGFLKCV